MSVDVVIPAAAGALTFGVLWLATRPDRIVGLGAVGVVLGIATAGLAVWGITLITNEVILPVYQRRTLGDRLSHTCLDLPDGTVVRLLCLVGRAILRAVLSVLIASAFGIATHFFGEGTGGILVGLVFVAMLVVAASVTIDGLTHVTWLDRLFRIRVVALDADNARP